MIRHTPKPFAACLAVFIFVTTIQAQTTVKIPASESLQVVVDEAARTTLAKFAEKKLEEKQLSITLINLRDATHPTMASFRGNERDLPCQRRQTVFPRCGPSLVGR